jgi:hypothetical protein
VVLRYTRNVQNLLLAPAAALAVAWLWFLARAKVRGSVKRLALRGTLLLVVAGLVAAGTRRGVFVRASTGFRLALLLALLAVAVGYLYLIRFCDTCGRMERNLKVAQCKRCGAYLPVDGMSKKLHRSSDGRNWDPAEARRNLRRRGR